MRAQFGRHRKPGLTTTMANRVTGRRKRPKNRPCPRYGSATDRVKLTEPTDPRPCAGSAERLDSRSNVQVNLPVSDPIRLASVRHAEPSKIYLHAAPSEVDRYP
jgi:hypothetical protein